MRQKLIQFLVLFYLAAGTLQGRALKSAPLQKNPDIEQQLKKIMVLYLGTNYEKRKMVESEVTYYINDSGFEAQQSFRHFNETDLPDTETIINTLEKNGFDGILVIEVVDVELKKERVNAHMTYGRGPGAPYLYDYFSIYRRYSEGYDRIETAFELETSLFRLEDKSLIYSNMSKAYNKGDIDLALEGFAKATAKKLKSSKALLKTK
jgi:hypothetical protein